MEKTGGFRSEFDGAQDYDFIFRCVENAEKIHHIPEILYHWRTHQASTADNPASKMYAFEAGKRAIEGNLKRSGLCGKVSHTKDLWAFIVWNIRCRSPLWFPLSYLIKTKKKF